MEAYDWILNNEPGRATRPTRRRMTSIIHLTYTTPDIVELETCVVDEELVTLSDYEVIL